MDTKSFMIRINNMRGAIQLMLLSRKKNVSNTFVRVFWEIGAISFFSSFRKQQNYPRMFTFRWIIGFSFLNQRQRIIHDLPALLSPLFALISLCSKLQCLFLNRCSVQVFRSPVICIWKSPIVLLYRYKLLLLLLFSLNNYCYVLTYTDYFANADVSFCEYDVNRLLLPQSRYWIQGMRVMFIAEICFQKVDLGQMSTDCRCQVEEGKTHDGNKNRSTNQKMQNIWGARKL